jgi:hypothetical protein
MSSSTSRRHFQVHPANDVVAVIDEATHADAAVKALRAAGFAGDDLHVFRGSEGIAALARAWWSHSGVPSFIAPLVAAVLSDERDVEKIYESEGLAGHTVLAAHCRSSDDVQRARRVLRDHGAHDTWFFGQWTMTDLGPMEDRNEGRAAR